jgi:hypothetical protein
MARSILEIAQEAAQRDNTAPAPTALFGSSTKISSVLRIAAGDTLREYMRRTGHTGLSELHSSWAFTLQPGRFAYPLPPDFLRIIPDTEHLHGSSLKLYGPASPAAWANWISGAFTVSPSIGWRIRNNAIHFEPTPSSRDLVVIEYISNYPVVSRIADGDYDMTTSPPTCTSPFVPRDGYLDLGGLDATPQEVQEGEYDDSPGWDVATFGAEIPDMLKRINPLSGRAPYPEVRRPAFTADTDYPAFADDYLLSLGMTFRLRRSLGLDYAEAAAEYEEEMSQRLDHDAGGARSIRLGQSGNDFGTYPLGNGKWMVS